MKGWVQAKEPTPQETNHDLCCTTFDYSSANHEQPDMSPFALTNHPNEGWLLLSPNRCVQNYFWSKSDFREVRLMPMAVAPIRNTHILGGAPKNNSSSKIASRSFGQKHCSRGKNFGVTDVVPELLKGTLPPGLGRHLCVKIRRAWRLRCHH